MIQSLKDVASRTKRILRCCLRNDLLQGRQIKLSTKHHGSNYGGWSIYPEHINKSSIVYSFGVGEDISFDTSLIKDYGVTVHAFDPTPKSAAWIRKQILPDQLIFQELGVASFDGTATFSAPTDPDHVSYSMTKGQDSSEHCVTAPVCRLITITKNNEHTHIDLLKMDIEGAEYAVIDDIIQSQVSVEQILVEFHHRFVPNGVEKTKKAIADLNGVGYHIFWVSPTGEEFAFARRDL